MGQAMKTLNLKNANGMALVTTLLFLTVMGILSTALIFTVQNEMKTSSSYKYSQQAFHVANSGVQRAIDWYVNGYTPHLPATDYNAATLPVTLTADGQNVVLAGQTGSTTHYPANPDGVINSFTNAMHDRTLQGSASNSGIYEVNATLLKYQPVSFIDLATFASYPSALERWRVNSIGYWGSREHPMGVSRISAIIENSGNALFDRALWGKTRVDLGGTVLIDSYNPALGGYSKILNAGNHGSIGSNGIISATGAVEVKGDLAYGPNGSYDSTPNVTVTGQVYHLQQPRVFPPIPPCPLAGCVVTALGQIKNATVSINPGCYDNIDMGPNGILDLAPGTYCINSLDEGASGKVTISGDTNIFVTGSIKLAGKGVVNPLGDPTRLTVFYSGVNEMEMVGGAQAFLEVYAPNAPLKFVGTSDFFGSFIGDTVTIQGTPEVHFDEGCLQQDRIQQQFRVIGWSQTPLSR
jgi:type II secretory pathway pseudopilin PulG